MVLYAKYVMRKRRYVINSVEAGMTGRGPPHE
jgi:hypothetical protein